MSGILRGGRQLSGHDVEFLIREWKALCHSRNWRIHTLFETDSHPVLAIENKAAIDRNEGDAYISAGVHGDECAPPWALLEWAEALPENEERALVFLPCLNPDGIAANTRGDRDGVDLNRNFQSAAIPVIAACHQFLAGRSFDCAINLHEDYDAKGIYLYELARSESVGHSLLSACEEVIARETAVTVDGSEFENGLLQRGVDERELRRVVEEDLEGGWPEAIWLYMNHAQDSFTFETPSEMELSTRIAAHRRFLDALLG